MRPLLVVLAALLLAVAGCGSEGAPVAVDPAGDTSPSESTAPSTPPSTSAVARPPTAVPAAPGLVRTRDLATVIDTGSPELCLGPMAESFPPQCGGPAVLGWDWARHGRGTAQQEGQVRWGSFAVTGRWDGTSLEVTEAVPAALYDAVAQEPPPLPEPARTYGEAELARIAEEVGRLPGAQGAYVDRGRRVLVDVTYDDGSLQAWADTTYGTGVVVVTGALVDVG